MNSQSRTGKEKRVTISPTDVKRFVDPYNDYSHNNKDNNDDEVVKGDYNDYDYDIDNDDYSLSSESLQDIQNSATASRDSSGSISYLFTDDEYDYRKSMIDEDDIDDDDDDDIDTEGDKKTALPRNYIKSNSNNETTTTTGVHTTNRRRALKRNQNKSQLLSDINFDSDLYYDNNELSSLNNSMTSLLVERSIRRFSPDYCSMPRRNSNSSSTTNPPSMPRRLPFGD